MEAYKSYAMPSKFAITLYSLKSKLGIVSKAVYTLAIFHLLNMLFDIVSLRLSDFNYGTTEQRQKFASDLFASFASSGCIRLTDHGFSEEDFAQLMQWVSPSNAFQACMHLMFG
jgi:hypothetical protein